MLSNILVATDGSEASDRMVECLTGLGRVGTERVLLTHVFNVRDVGGLYETLRVDMTPRLDAQQRVLERAGLRVAAEAHLGVSFVEINAAADRFDASLVVVGSLGASMLREALLGSTAHKILEHARRPVLLVRLEITNGGDEGRRCRVACSDRFGHILFPTDFSDTAERAFAYLEHVVGATGSAVTLLHVQDRAKIERHLHDRLQEFNEIDQARLDRMKEHLERILEPPPSSNAAWNCRPGSRSTRHRPVSRPRHSRSSRCCVRSISSSVPRLASISRRPPLRDREAAAGDPRSSASGGVRPPGRTRRSSRAARSPSMPRLAGRWCSCAPRGVRPAAATCTRIARSRSSGRFGRLNCARPRVHWVSPTLSCLATRKVACAHGSLSLGRR
ncbi:MAG: universal stress protein [Acidobacteria bacterium]|nr:universal stress protein [Acidobacteriota bacterium]